MKQKYFIFLLLVFSSSTMADSFTYNFQMAGYDFQQYDEKGTTDYANFVREFQAFPWMNQIGKANGGTEPTISVTNHDNGTSYFVSIIGQPSKFAYLVGIVSPKQVETYFGFGEPKTVRWVQMYVAEEEAIVEHTYKLFFDSKIEKLKLELSKLEKFDEMEATN